MSTVKNINIRKLVPKDWPLILSWFDELSWPNFHMFFDEIRYCTVYVAIDENDVAVSTITCGNFEKYVKLNNYATDPKCRGNGFGLKLCQSVIELTGPEKNFFFVAVPQMAKKYKSRSQSIQISSVDIENYSGTLTSDFIKLTIGKLRNNDPIVINDQLNESSVKDIIAYDSILHNENTFAFLTVWLAHSNRSDKNVDPYFHPPLYTVYARNEVTGQIAGYGTVFKCVKTSRIGPLHAESFAICLKILENLIHHRFEPEAPERQHEFNVLSTQTNFKQFLVESGFKFNYKFHRMFTKDIVDLVYEKMFSLNLHVGLPE